MADNTCICPYGDRCRALAVGFAEECPETVALARGGYVQIPPSDTDHLNPSPSFSVRPNVESLPDVANSKNEKKGKTLTSWQQIQRACVRYFHLLAKGDRGDDFDNGEDADEDDLLDYGASDSLQDPHPLFVVNGGDSAPATVWVALHHFHPRISMPMMNRQQFWDKTPVWQCLHSNSLAVLLKDEDTDMMKQIINQSNRIKKESDSGGDDEHDEYAFPSYVVLPSYPIARAEHDFQRLKLAPVLSKSGSKRDLTPATEASSPQGDEDSDADESSSVSSQPFRVEDTGVIEEAVPKHYRNNRISELHQQRDSYHETLLSFERMRRAAADERLKHLMNEWVPHYQTLVELIKEFQRVDGIMQSTCTAIYNYTKSLQLLCTPKTSDDFLNGVLSATDAGAIIEPLVTAFSSVGRDWQDDLPHIKECSDDFETLRNQVESAAQQIQLRYNSLQHAAVEDETAIRQAWCELEELCIIDSAVHNRRGVIEDRWLRELAYRRLIVVEKTSVKSKLQPILDSVVALDVHCQTRMHEVFSAFLPKHRRLFLRTRELFDPATDALESGVMTQEEAEREVDAESSPLAVEDVPTLKQKSSGGLLSVFGAALGGGKTNEHEEGEIEHEMTQLGNLLKSVHIYEVQIVSFRVEQNTWVTSFCVITHQQYMHFFPLLPGTDFESLRKEARPALAAACVAAWEKGSTPLLSVLLTTCSYGLSPDGSFIELIITTPPRKKIGLRVGSKEECDAWVQKTQRWVMLFSSVKQ